MSVVELHQYRQSPTGPCTVTLIGHPHSNSSGELFEPSATFYLMDGNYKELIEGFRDEGGFYVNTEKDGIWFCPWPPLGVQIMKW